MAILKQGYFINARWRGANRTVSCHNLVREARHTTVGNTAYGARVRQRRWVNTTGFKFLLANRFWPCVPRRLHALDSAVP